MNLGLVEIFCAVYEEKSFSKAAKRLHLTQPTVSGHIKTLEEYFNTSLFDRLGREIQPTRAGEMLYRHGRPLLEIKKAIHEHMSRFLNQLEGKLDISASTIPAEYLLPTIIGRFHKVYPKVEVTMTVSDSRGVTADVAQGRVDLGFAGARLKDGNLEFRKFASDRLIFVVPNNKQWAAVKSIQLKDLQQLPLLIREPGSGTRATLEDRLAKLGTSLADFNIVAQFGSTSAIKQAVTADVGISIISNLSVQREIHWKLIKEVRIDELQTFERDFFVVRNKKRTPSPTCESFLEFVFSGK